MNLPILLEAVSLQTMVTQHQCNKHLMATPSHTQLEKKNEAEEEHRYMS